MYHGMISNVFHRWLLIICQLLKVCEYRVLFLGPEIVIEKNERKQVFFVLGPVYIKVEDSR